MHLHFGNRIAKPQVRMLYDLRDVVYDRAWFESAPNAELYYMYRDLFLSKRDEGLLKERGLRYDITIIPPRMLGREFVKTLGHFHAPLLGSELTYPEVYEVLSGEAHYLMQRLEGEKVMDIVVVKAKKGDKVIVPPSYGHVTINPSNKILKMANFVARNFESNYAPFKSRGGAAYFELASGFVKNNSYASVPEIRFLKPCNFSELKLKKGREMYQLAREGAETLEWLTSPGRYASLFTKVLNNSYSMR